jgi:hypothetical protein
LIVGKLPRLLEIDLQEVDPESYYAAKAAQHKAAAAAARAAPAAAEQVTASQPLPQQQQQQHAEREQPRAEQEHKEQQHGWRQEQQQQQQQGPGQRQFAAVAEEEGLEIAAGRGLGRQLSPEGSLSEGECALSLQSLGGGIESVSYDSGWVECGLCSCV